MSGGYFDYIQFGIRDTAEKIRKLVRENDNYSHPLSGETIARFNEAALLLSYAEVYVHEIDWLASGDTGEDSFHKNLEEAFKNLPHKMFSEEEE